ncbi:MAG: methionyl-tRNA formyltransferase [Gemmatimonadales bacterium]
MRVVFLGTPEFAVPSLAALLAADVEVAAVVTQPDRPSTRSHSRLTAPPVKRFARAAGLPVWQPERPRGDAFFDQLRSVDADLGVVVAYGHLLPRELLEIPHAGLVNVHASLLPRWRGAAPIQWALLSGDPETGVSIMRIATGLDTGPVWHQERIAIGADDTAGSLALRLATLGASTLVATLPAVARGDVPMAQSDAGITHAPKIDRATARIRWHDPAVSVSSRIRAMDPAPGAWTVLDGKEIKLFGATVVASHTTTPGRIVEHASRLLVETGDGAVEIVAVQPAGRRRIAAREWLNGAHFTGPSRFE